MRLKGQSEKGQKQDRCHLYLNHLNQVMNVYPYNFLGISSLAYAVQGLLEANNVNCIPG